MRNHLGSKKNTFVIIVITFCNYPYAVLLEQRKTTVNLLLRSPSKPARPFHGAACFKGGVTLGSCVNTVMKREHTVRMVKPPSSKPRSPGQHIFGFCVTVRVAEHWRKGCFALLISQRELSFFEWCREADTTQRNNEKTDSSCWDAASYLSLLGYSRTYLFVFGFFLYRPRRCVSCVDAAVHVMFSPF